MVEVFKTNVKHAYQAEMLVERLQELFINYLINFDLQDCDRIMRVKCAGGLVNAASIISLVNELGFHAEILPDEPGSFTAINPSNDFYSHSNQLN